MEIEGLNNISLSLTHKHKHKHKHMDITLVCDHSSPPDGSDLCPNGPHALMVMMTYPSYVYIHTP